MPLAVLLNPDDPLFTFEHMMQHREYFAIMAPLDRFSILPYLLDPTYGTDIRAGPWHLSHQQAHNDFTQQLPPFWDARHVGFGIPTDQILVDSNLQDPESRTWWTFVNHQEHFTTNEAILPLPATDPNPPGWWTQIGPATYPFW
jgi:hypothetical protein